MPGGLFSSADFRLVRYTGDGLCAVAFVRDDFLRKFTVCTATAVTFQDTKPQLLHSFRFIFQFSPAGAMHEKQTTANGTRDLFSSRNVANIILAVSGKLCYNHHDWEVKEEAMIPVMGVLQHAMTQKRAWCFLFAFSDLKQTRASPRAPGIYREDGFPSGLSFSNPALIIHRPAVILHRQP